MKDVINLSFTGNYDSYDEKIKTWNLPIIETSVSSSTRILMFQLPDDANRTAASLRFLKNLSQIFLQTVKALKSNWIWWSMFKSVETEKSWLSQDPQPTATWLHLIMIYWLHRNKVTSNFWPILNSNRGGNSLWRSLVQFYHQLCRLLQHCHCTWTLPGTPPPSLPLDPCQ